jgi:hypothetical protein
MGPSENVIGPECSFLIPVVRDSDRLPHPAILWRLLQDAMLKAFGGLTGPEAVLYYRTPSGVPGTWLPSGGEASVEDESRKYTVAVPADRIDDLRALLRRAGNSFGQRVIYLTVAGQAELLDVRPEDGFLEI